MSLRVSSFNPFYMVLDLCKEPGQGPQVPEPAPEVFSSSFGSDQTYQMSKGVVWPNLLRRSWRALWVTGSESHLWRAAETRWVSGQDQRLHFPRLGSLA